MGNLLGSPLRALMLGLALGAALVVVVLVGAGVDRMGLVSFLVRWLHIVAAVVWVGMIWFVNFIQLVAVAEADQPARAAIMKHIVPRVALTFRQASHWTIGSGAVLLVTTGYLAGSLVYATPVFVPTMRNVMMWAGVIGALAMYMLVHMMIWPGLRIVLGIDPGDAEKVAAARARVAFYARWNLVLAVPVTVAMVAAGHLV